MSTYDAWFRRYALRNRLMFFCRLFSPAVGRGSFALSTFLDRRTQRVKLKYEHSENIKADCLNTFILNLHQIKCQAFFGTPVTKINIKQKFA